MTGTPSSSNYGPRSDDRRLLAREIGCPCCGSSSVGAHLLSEAGEILRCRACRHVFLSPRAWADRLEDLYSKDYFTAREGYFFKDGVFDSTGVESPHVEDFRKGLDSIESLAPASGNLLDVGCATGSFMRLAQERGWECYGVELSDFAASFASQKFGSRVFHGRFSDTVYPEEFFDVLTMWDLIEHLPEPREALAKAHGILKPSGLLLVNTPNEDSLTRWTSRAIYRMSGGTVQSAVNKVYHRYHFNYFSAQTLSILFDKAGFEVVARRTKAIPMSRGRISPAARAIIKALSVAERLLRAEYELMFIARKK